MDEHRLRRTVECRDVGGRRKTLRVLAEPGRVYLLAPPGEVAELDPRSIAQLKAALDEALVAAVRGELP
jgi:hypothetical protein